MPSQFTKLQTIAEHPHALEVNGDISGSAQQRAGVNLAADLVAGDLSP
jgi:hypothetical protein